jgi:hypothetical protein
MAEITKAGLDLARKRLLDIVIHVGTPSKSSNQTEEKYKWLWLIFEYYCEHGQK